MPDVTPGTWLLSPRRAREIAAYPQVIRVEPGASRVVADVRLARGLFVRGRLVTPDGETGVGGWVSAFGPVRANADTSRAVEFVLGPLAPGKFQLIGRPYNSYLDSEAVEVVAPAEDVLLLSRPGAEVSGQVSMRWDRRAGGDRGCERGRFEHADAHAAGRLLPPRRLSLRVRARSSPARTTAGGTAHRRRARAGLAAANQHVVLGPGSTLRLRYEGSGDRSYCIRHGGANLGCDALSSGRSLSMTVPPGRVVVEYWTARAEPEKRIELDLAPAETREIVLK
jgi:hypothetical protein